MSSTNPSPSETAEFSSRPVVIDRQHWFVLSLLTTIFMIGLLGYIGLAYDLPNLYTWDSSIVMTLHEAQALMLLAVGVVAYMGAKFFGRQGLVWVARLCFLGAFVLGCAEFVVYTKVPAGWSLIQLLVPGSPLQGHIPVYSAIGFTVAGLTSLLFTGHIERDTWLPTIVQGIGIFLMSLGLSGLFENIGDPFLFHYLSSIPVSLSLLLYGLVLLFLPFERQLLGFPFFGSPVIQRYAWTLCLFWGFSIAWQSIWNNIYFGAYHIGTDADYFRVALNEVVEIVLSALILSLGLHILRSLSEQDKMAKSLQESSQKLRTSLDSVALLASTLSHDLKAPILTQMKAIEMLSSGRYGADISSPANQEMLSAILDNNQFELDLVLNLINLLRYKIQDQQFHPKEIKLPAILDEIRKELAPLAMRKDQELTVYTSVSEAEQTLMADPLGLKRILHNLINNAILHLSEGHHIRLDVRLQGEEFLFSVRDDGPGIPLARQANLFNQFNRMSSSGLGLYIAKQIVERHGGKIWVESQLKQGASFFFTLPKTPLNLEGPPRDIALSAGETESVPKH